MSTQNDKKRGRAVRALLLAAAFTVTGSAFSARAANPVPQQTPRPEKKKLKAGASFEQYAGRDASNRLIAGGATRELNAYKALMKQGEEYYGARNYKEARESFGGALKEAETDNHRAKAYYHLGVINETMGQNKEAIEAYESALRLKPTDMAVLAFSRYNLANLYATVGRFDDAIEQNKQVVAMPAFAGEAVAHHNLGMSYLRADKYEEAQASFKEAVRLKADYPEALFYLGLTKLLLSDVRPESLDEYKTLLTLKPALAEQLKKATTEISQN